MDPQSLQRYLQNAQDRLYRDVTASKDGAIQKAYGFDVTDEWLRHLQLSSVRFGGASGSFVSPDGLVMTNHHCARDAVVAVQGANDWLKDGFYAGAYEAEVKLPGFVMSQMVRQQDVTKQVNEMGQQQVLDHAKAQDPSHMHQVIALYQGGMYQLYSFKIFDDLRLVCATNRDLLQLAREGKFREDLYYRLNVVRIRMPSLRERVTDVPQIVDFCLQNLVKQKKARTSKVAVPASPKSGSVARSRGLVARLKVSPAQRSTARAPPWAQSIAAWCRP
jgi:hypothetical protein